MKTIDDFAKINFRKALSSSEAFTLQFINPFVYNNFHLAFDKLNDVQKSGSIKLLDVGCGEQPYRSLIEKIGFKYVGMDVAARNVKLDVVAPIDDKNLLCDNRRGNIYDVIVLTEVLEHVDNHEQAWLNLSGLCREGGFIIITAPFIYPLHEQPWDACRPTIYQLSRNAERHGFKVETAIRAGGVSDVVGLLFSTIHKPTREANLISRFLGYIAWACLRIISKILLKFKFLDFMKSEYYVTNLFVCRKMETVSPLNDQVPG